MFRLPWSIFAALPSQTASATIRSSLTATGRTVIQLQRLPARLLVSPWTCTSGTIWTPQCTLSSVRLTTQCWSSPQTAHGASLYARVHQSKMTLTRTRRCFTSFARAPSIDARFADNVSRSWDLRMKQAKRCTTTIWCSQRCFTSKSKKKTCTLTWTISSTTVPKPRCRQSLRLTSTYK